MEQNLSDAERFERIHADMTSDQTVVRNVIMDVTGQEALEMTRIIRGESNEVYDITLADDSSVITRINHNSGENFAREIQGLDRCRQAGVPVPVVVGHGTFLDNNRERHYMIEEKLPGQTFHELLRNDSLSAAEAEAITVQAGEVLAQIHSIPTEGFGALAADGRGKYNSVNEWFSQITAKKELFRDLFNRYGLSDKFESVFDQLERADSPLFNKPPHLLHVDYAPKHILVDQGKITGVIDFEFASSGYFGFDIPEWELRDATTAPMSWLLKGYETIRPLDPADTTGQNLCALNEYLELLEYYGHKRPSGSITKTCVDAIKKLAA